jgi:hypothetical protein
VLLRHKDVSGVSGIGVVAVGIRFDDGRCAMRWRLDIRATALYDTIHELEAIHGHDGHTEIVWIDNAGIDFDTIQSARNIEEAKRIIRKEEDCD